MLHVSDEKVVFVKDMAYYLLAGPLPHVDLLPKGYQHTFLIRDPHKSLPSLNNIARKKAEPGNMSIIFCPNKNIN